jgi:molybdopterin converting factor small subunit
MIGARAPEVDVHVTVRLGGELARATGTPRLALDVADGSTVADLRRTVADRHPELGGALGATLAIIAGAHAAPDLALPPGAEVAFLLPAAGG